MPSLLCLDLGTSAAKAALLSLDGTTFARASSSYPTRHLDGGGAEQDPRDWLRAARSAITQVLDAFPAAGHPEDGRLLALGLTGQMQDLVLDAVADSDADSDGSAVLYSDTRAGAEAEELHHRLAHAGTPWDQLSGNLQDASSCAAMFLRRSRRDPELVGRVRAVVFGPAGHLVHRLGLGAWCDPTTAAATGLLDARTRTWSVPVAEAAGIGIGLLPRLTTEAGQIVGRTDARAATLLGLPAGIPVVLAPGDAGATTLGLVGLEPGDDYVSLGTSGWHAAVLPAGATPATAPGISHHLALGARPHPVGDMGATPGLTLRISALLAAGAAAAWAREALLGGVDAAEADELLDHRERENGRGPTGLLALPSLLGERYPVRDATLRGAVIGMTPQTRAIDMYSAVLEGVAHALAPAGEGAGTSPLAVTGGGAASAPWLRILADVTGREVRAVEAADAALVGCGIAAADALGTPLRPVPLAQRGEECSVMPDPSAAAAHRALRPAHRALYSAVGEVLALR